MPAFPDDFLDSDGRFRAVVQSDSTPVIYVTANGSYVCADCLNAIRATLDDQEKRDGWWDPVTYELLTYDPAICCEFCSHAMAPLYGQGDTS
ncbi:MAG: hypothetical protein AB2L07_16160 [Thermoanaerobaculaceae bacterium]